MDLSWGLKNTGSLIKSLPPIPGSITVPKLEDFSLPSPPDHCHLITLSTQTFASPHQPRCQPPSPRLPYHRQDRPSSGPGPGPRSCPHRFAWHAGRRSSHPWYIQLCHCLRCPSRSQEGESPAQSAEAVHQFVASLSEVAPPPGWVKNGGRCGRGKSIRSVNRLLSYSLPRPSLRNFTFRNVRRKALVKQKILWDPTPQPQIPTQWFLYSTQRDNAQLNPPAGLAPLLDLRASSPRFLAWVPAGRRGDIPTEPEHC